MPFNPNVMSVTGSAYIGMNYIFTLTNLNGPLQCHVCRRLLINFTIYMIFRSVLYSLSEKRTPRDLCTHPDFL